MPVTHAPSLHIILAALIHSCHLHYPTIALVLPCPSPAKMIELFQVSTRLKKVAASPVCASRLPMHQDRRWISAVASVRSMQNTIIVFVRRVLLPLLAGSHCRVAFKFRSAC